METNTTKEKSRLKEFFSLGEVGEYFFRKKSASQPNNINIRMMHGVNKFSIVIFIIAVIYMIAKRFI